jgi:hypothetical protein
MHTFRLFAKALSRSVWAYLTMLSTMVTAILLPHQWRWAVPTGVAILVIIGAFRAVAMIRNEYETQIIGLQQEIKRLAVRPYDEAQSKLAKEKICSLTVLARDLLRYLLQRGAHQAPRLNAIAKSTGVEDGAYNEAFSALRYAALIECPPGQSLWGVNPRFEGILKDLFFPRQEQEEQRHFLP